MYKIDSHCACAVAGTLARSLPSLACIEADGAPDKSSGITADANILINWVRLEAQRYLYTYQEPIPIELLVQELCDLKQGYTQYGGA